MRVDSPVCKEHTGSRLAGSAARVAETRFDRDLHTPHVATEGATGA